MHDGYIFTLGICGTSSASSPAPMLLDAMLAALPPVKRAALLGDIMLLDHGGKPNDPLLDPIVRDMVDAELLLIVTPVWSDEQLPLRLLALLKRAMPLAETGALSGKMATLVGIVPPSRLRRPPFLPIYEFCKRANMTVSSILESTEEAAQGAWSIQRVTEMAQGAYAEVSAALQAQNIPHLR
ncbi:MAG: hypothetical protein MI924_29205 [Chloroflexales bacterium]|nr:hypothetical protein [Chloroflexales bacterium]